MTNQNILIFDTETISVAKPFCYNVGYVIIDSNGNTLTKKDFVITQMWENKALFETSYYAEKKPLYVSKLRGRQAKLIKYGFAMREMLKDIQAFNVNTCCAYNSTFDVRVFDFNCEWYKCTNPLDYVSVVDIWGLTSELITRDKANDYVEFCETNNLISESGNLINNANAWGKFFNGIEWEEEHTALADSEIEAKILYTCLMRDIELKSYKVAKCIPSKVAPLKTLTIKTPSQTFEFSYKKKTEYKSKDLIVLSE